MTDYEADHDGDQGPKQVKWITIWGDGENHGLLMACIWVAAVAVAGWVLTQLLTT